VGEEAIGVTLPLLQFDGDKWVAYCIVLYCSLATHETICL